MRTVLKSKGPTNLQVSYVVLGGVGLIVIILWLLTKQVWIFMGQDEEISSHAGYYSGVLAFSIPGLIGYGQLSQYYSAQQIMRPEVISSMIILGLIFVLGIPIPNFHGYGFKAWPFVTTIVEYIQDLFFWFVCCHIQKLHAPAWGGWSLAEVTKERIWIFCQHSPAKSRRDGTKGERYLCS